MFYKDYARDPAPEINAYLSELKTASGSRPLPQVMLIFGDELLYKSALQTLLDAIIPSGKSGIRL